MSIAPNGPDKCNLTFDNSSTQDQRLSLAKDHTGRPVIVKKITIPDNPREIDTHCRFHHRNLIHAWNVLVPGVCKIDKVYLILEPALFTLKEFIQASQSTVNYFEQAEDFSEDIILGVSYLHHQGVCHNKIHLNHIMIKVFPGSTTVEGRNVAALTDFKYATGISSAGITQDLKNSGVCILKMFLLDSSDIIDLPDEEITNGLYRYRRKFGRNMNGIEFFRSKSIDIESSEFPKKTITIKVSQKFRDIFIQVCKYFLKQNSLVYQLYFYLHTLYRLESLKLDYDFGMVSNFCKYSLDQKSNPTECLPWISKFEGVLLANTVFDTFTSIQDLLILGKTIFNSRDYLKVYNYNYKCENFKELVLLDIKNSELFSMISNPEKFLV